MSNVIEQHFDLVRDSVNKGDYTTITSNIIELCNVLENTETDECTWCIGEYGEYTLADLLIGAFWHYTEWHGGQYSLSYAALSAIGSVYSPGYSDSPEEGTGEQTVYDWLNEIAEQETTR